MVNVKNLSMQEAIHAHKISRRDTFRVAKDNKLDLPDVSLEEPADVTAARDQLLFVTQRTDEIERDKTRLLEKLEETKKENDFLEESLTKKISNEEKRELLLSLCKIHECQIKNMELESISLMKDYSLQEKDLILQRTQMRNSLIDELVDMQRKIITGTKKTTSFPELFV